MVLSFKPAVQPLQLARIAQRGNTLVLTARRPVTPVFLAPSKTPLLKLNVFNVHLANSRAAVHRLIVTRALTVRPAHRVRSAASLPSGLQAIGHPAVSATPVAWVQQTEVYPVPLLAKLVWYTSRTARAPCRDPSLLSCKLAV